MSSESVPFTKKITQLIHSFYNELLHGSGTQHFIKVMASPIGILGTFFVFLSLFLGVIPTSSSAYSQSQTLINILWFVFFYMALAESWNIIGGYAGEIDFGHVLFVGMGIYTEAILINDYHAMNWFTFLGNNIFSNVFLPLAVTIFISGLSAVVVALIIGIPVLRLRGAYFAIAMLAFSQALLIIFLVIGNFQLGFHFWFINFDFPYKTNGGTGVNVGALTKIDPNYSTIIYFLIIGVSMVAFLISHYVSYSRLGLSLRAIKGSPDGASSIGINVLKTKLEAFAISAFIAGIAGAVYILKIFDVTPEVGFDVHVTVQMIIMTLLGGSASVFGPVIGALIVWPIRSLLSQNLTGVYKIFGFSLNFNVAYLIVYGLIFVFAVLYLPKGIIGYLEDRGILKRESLILDDQLEKLKEIGDELHE